MNIDFDVLINTEQFKKLIELDGEVDDLDSGFRQKLYDWFVNYTGFTEFLLWHEAETFTVMGKLVDGAIYVDCMLYDTHRVTQRQMTAEQVVMCAQMLDTDKEDSILEQAFALLAFSKYLRDLANIKSTHN